MLSLTWIPNIDAFNNLLAIDPNMTLIWPGVTGAAWTPVNDTAGLAARGIAAEIAFHSSALQSLFGPSSIMFTNIVYAQGTYLDANPIPRVVMSYVFSTAAAVPITFYAGCLGTCTMSLNHGQQTWTLVSVFDPTPRPYVLQATTVAGVNTIDVYARAFPDVDFLDLHGIYGIAGLMLRANISGSSDTFFRTVGWTDPRWTWTWVPQELTTAELFAKYGLKGAIQQGAAGLAENLRTFQARASTLKTAAHAASDALQAQTFLQHQRVKALGAAMSARVKFEAAASTV